MEVRAYALGIVTAETLDGKLRALPRGLTDLDPGPPLCLERPGRPPALRIVPGAQAKVPPARGMADPSQRARILHALANHELQAVELFAWALLAFPDAPREFREGLLGLVREEVAHARLYLNRLEDFGVRLGDYPVTGYFWSKVKTFTTPLRFVCALNLTFENANLDHSADYAEAADAAGDARTAALLRKVGEDEVRHVRFGREWLEAWKEPGQSLYEAYSENVTWPLRSALGRGERFRAEPRAAAGLDAEFIRALEAADRRVDPRKAPR